MSWNFNTDGFQSIVAYAPLSSDQKFDLPEDFKPGLNGTHLLVRARIEADLDAMAAYDPDAVRFSDLSADYSFRMIIRRSAAAQYYFDLTMGIDYDSHVKETIDRRAPKVQGGRMGVLGAIWSKVASWQPTAPYAGKYVSKTTYTGPSWSRPIEGEGKYVSPYGSDAVYDTPEEEDKTDAFLRWLEADDEGDLWPEDEPPFLLD